MWTWDSVKLLVPILECLLQSTPGRSIVGVSSIRSSWGYYCSLIFGFELVHIGRILHVVWQVIPVAYHTIREKVSANICSIHLWLFDVEMEWSQSCVACSCNINHKCLPSGIRHYCDQCQFSSSAKRNLKTHVDQVHKELLYRFTVLSQMTDVPDNRTSQMAEFKQIEEVYNISIYF